MHQHYTVANRGACNVGRPYISALIQIGYRAARIVSRIDPPRPRRAARYELIELLINGRSGQLWTHEWSERACRPRAARRGAARARYRSRKIKADSHARPESRNSRYHVYRAFRVFRIRVHAEGPCRRFYRMSAEWRRFSLLRMKIRARSLARNRHDERR